MFIWIWKVNEPLDPAYVLFIFNAISNLYNSNKLFLFSNHNIQQQKNRIFQFSLSFFNSILKEYKNNPWNWNKYSILEEQEKKCNWANKIVQEFNSRIKKLPQLRLWKYWCICMYMLVSYTCTHTFMNFFLCINAIYCRNIHP